MSSISPKTFGRPSLATLLTAILIITSIASIVFMQTNNAAAANVLFKEKFRGKNALLQKTITEGGITTQAEAEGFTTLDGKAVICVDVIQFDSTNLLTEFEGCGPAQQLTVSNSLSSATFSGTVTGFDFVTNEEKTVTVNADLTATGKVQTTTSTFHINARDFKQVSNSHGKIVPASGSLNIGGDINFSTDDASGRIGDAQSGSIIIQKN
jgi:hypothetical protein